MIINFAAEEVRPGSMGRPLPGAEAGLAGRGEDGKIRELGPGERQPDELALRRGRPSMFRGYWRDPQRYDGSFSDGGYVTGDIVRRDEDGYFRFGGRTGDVISANGYLVSPVRSGEPGEELRLELLSFGRRALGAPVPAELAFEAWLPKTRSGKVLRRVRKARELGLPAGDPSTVEEM